MKKFLLFILIIITFVSCQAEKEKEITLSYYGVSSFTLHDESTSIGIDFFRKYAFPYAEDTPKAPGFDDLDLSMLLITHDHADHYYLL